MNMKPLLLAPASLLFAHAAAAATVSGTYNLVLNENCQITISTSKNKSGDIVSVNTVNNGKISQTIGLVTFAPGTRKATVSGFQDKGDMFIEQNVGGQPMAPSPFGGTFAYATTATTLTLGSTVYKAIYSQIKSGIAYHVDFLGIDKPGCSSIGSAEHQ